MTHPIDAKLRAVIDAAAALVSLPSFAFRSTTYNPGELLEGLILTESAGNPRARRYEPHQDRAGRKDQAQDADLPNQDDGDLEDDASYGLMQVMGYNIRRLCQVPDGTAMKFGWCFLPLINISLGLRVLLGELEAVRLEVAANKIPSGRNVDRALARYNGGPTGDDLVGGAFRLQAYVDKVGRNAALARADRQRLNWR